VRDDEMAEPQGRFSKAGLEAFSDGVIVVVTRSGRSI
jgi:hypothetical protein